MCYNIMVWEGSFMAKVICICGKICSGKTTLARELAAKERAVILSCDEILDIVFHKDLGERHDAVAADISKYLHKKARDLLSAGCSVIFDWGFWQKKDRDAARKMYEGTAQEWHYIDISDEIWNERIAKRNADVLAGKSDDYFVDEGLRSKLLSRFDEPTKDEIDIWHEVKYMDREMLRRQWLLEEEIAHIHGWDFSHINERHEEEDPPWSYEAIVREYLRPDMQLLDIDTGGGEKLLSLGHPHENTAATENYPPNVVLCNQILGSLGVDFQQACGEGPLPWQADRFDIITNRHGAYRAAEYARVLKKGGLFITQQVGAMNDRSLVDLLCPGVSESFQGHWLKDAVAEFEAAGFEILRAEENIGTMRFFDVGALTWFARVIPWEFVDFSVETHFENLLKAQEIVERSGCVEGETHRFLLVARKK